jgi:hypothetical protein
MNQKRNFTIPIKNPIQNNVKSVLTRILLCSNLRTRQPKKIMLTQKQTYFVIKIQDYYEFLNIFLSHEKALKKLLNLDQQISLSARISEL